MVLPTDNVQECFTHFRFLFEEKCLALCFSVDAQVVPEILTDTQGLIRDHFSAQRKRFLWDGGCIEGLSRDV